MYLDRGKIEVVHGAEHASLALFEEFNEPLHALLLFSLLEPFLGFSQIFSMAEVIEDGLFVTVDKVKLHKF